MNPIPPTHEVDADVAMAINVVLRTLATSTIQFNPSTEKGNSIAQTVEFTRAISVLERITVKQD